MPGFVGELAERVHDVELALIVGNGHVESAGHARSPIGLGQLLVLAVPAAEPTSGQRAPRQDAHPVLLRHRKDVGLDAPDQQ